MAGTVFAILLVATLVMLTLARLTAERLIRHHHGQKKDFFHHHPIQPGDIVFLGDSLTDGARWDELLPGLPTKNRGINADTTRGVLARLDEILAGRPAAIFLLIGTNDLPFFAYRSDRSILMTYEEILQRCKQDSPNTRIFVQSLFPRQRRFARRICRLNERLIALAGKHACVYVDIYTRLTTPQGTLQPELTNDGLHLLAEGYRRWVDAISEYVPKTK